MTSTVRAALSEDIPAITVIYGDSVLSSAASYEYDPPSEAHMAQRWAEVLAQGFPYVVAELDGKVVGFAYASAYRTRIGYRYTVENSVYVDVRHQGCGIGKHLMAAVIAACEKQGMRQMVAVIGDRANVASIKLHESCGFKLIGIFPSLGFKFGRWVDCVQMQLALGEGDSSLPK